MIVLTQWLLCFGTPGLFPINKVYDVLDVKMKICKKPIFPVLPSTITANDEVSEFLKKGRINFPDEVILGQALCRVFNTDKPESNELKLPKVNKNKIREIIKNSNSGYLIPESVQQLLDAAGIPRAKEFIVDSAQALQNTVKETGFPIVMKVVGPIHKTDVGGVVLDVKSEQDARKEFNRMMKIQDTTAVLIQPMLSGLELFVGAKKEGDFGHMILCGLGGVYIEVLKDVSSVLSPVSKSEAVSMIQSLKSYKLIQGVRGKEGVNEDKFAEIICKLSALLETAPEIEELDLNPLLGTTKQIIAVDARIRIC